MSLKLAPIEPLLKFFALLFILQFIISSCGIDLLWLSTTVLLFGLLGLILFSIRGNRL